MRLAIALHNLINILNQYLIKFYLSGLFIVVEVGDQHSVLL